MEEHLSQSWSHYDPSGLHLLDPILRSHAPSLPASESVLKIRWKDHFPVQINSELSIQKTNYEQVAQFLNKNWKIIKSHEAHDSRFLNAGIHPAKESYYKMLGDFFEFKLKGETVGVFVGTVSDWSSYYMRYAFILPQFQNLGFFKAMILQIIRSCEDAKVERVEVDISPSNSKSLTFYGKLQFSPVSTSISERWGASLRLVKFTMKKNEEHFQQLFCHGVRHQQHPSEC